MHKRSLLWLSATLFLASGAAQGQSMIPDQPDILFKQLTLEHGYPHMGTSYAHSILKSADGYIWFTTLHGLARYDGQGFKNYYTCSESNNCLPLSQLAAIQEDADGNIWIGSARHGIIFFDRKKETFRYLHKPGVLKNLQEPAVTFIERDTDGNMWYGNASGLRKWEASSDSITIPVAIAGAAYAFRQLTNGHLLIGVKGGACYYNISRREATMYPLPEGHADSDVVDFIELENGTIWVLSAPDRAWRLNLVTGAYTDISRQVPFVGPNKPAGFETGIRGDIWLRSASGLTRYNQFTQAVQTFQHKPGAKNGLPASAIADILVDDGHIYVSSFFDGIAIGNAQLHGFKDIGAYQSIEFLNLPDDLLAIRDFNQGCLLYDTKAQRLLPQKLPLGKGEIFIPTMAMRGDSMIWSRDPDGIHSYHLKTKQYQKAPANPWSNLYLHVDPEGRVWNGFAYLDEVSATWQTIWPDMLRSAPQLRPFKDSYATKFFDTHGHIWMIIDGFYDIVKYHIPSKELTIYPNRHESTTFLSSRDGSVCINGSGISCYDIKRDSFIHIPILHGDQSVFVLNGIVRNGSVWMGAAHGLFWYNIKDSRLQKIDFADGLPWLGDGVIRNFDIDDAGYIYFDINMERIIRFHPDSLTPNTETGFALLEDFYIDRIKINIGDSTGVLKRSLPATGELHLNHTQSNFGISFNMPLPYKADQITFYYQLYPYHKTWISNGKKREVHFTNIDAGRYTFKVKARSASGVWSLNEAVVAIRVFPPWWKTVWAWLAYTALFSCLMYSLYAFNLKRRLEHAEGRRLKELDQLKSQLYTNITHEFRTPLSVIMGVADGLKDTAKKNIISRNSKNLLRLINQLLDLSKLDSGSMTVDWVKGDIIHYLRYITESFYSVAAEKGVKLTFYTEVNTLMMDFDEVKIQHILYNLLSNAIKFTPKNGQVVLNVRTITDPDKDQLQITVSDTGIGILPQNISNIFNRFYQVDSSSTRSVGGTGIGLALTKDLIQLLDGTIEVRSEEGKGSHFVVRLPIHTMAPISYQEEPESSTSLPDDEMDTAEALPVTVLNPDARIILIIEDNRDVAAYVKDILKEDYQVLTAADGREGIAMATSTLPDLVISDVMMPFKNGYEVCETLKGDETTNHIPIILLTAKAEQKDKVTGLTYGADAYLVKPFDKMELLVRIQKLIEGRNVLQQKYQMRAPEPGTAILKPVAGEDSFVTKVRAYVEAHIDNEKLSLQQLSEAFDLSTMQFHRKIKFITGLTPAIYIRSIRLKRAYNLLLQGEMNVSETAYSVGFSDPAYFSRVFREEFGRAPGELLK